MKSVTKIICALLSIVTFAVGGCSKKGEKSSTNGTPSANVNLTSNDVEVWTAPATEKILRNLSIYDDMKTEKSISLLMAKNEYESGQVIITAKRDIGYYDVSVGDLVMAGTNNRIPSGNISVYNEKYINVTATYDTYGFPPQGMYPDALLPFETAKKYGENAIKNSENQGIYITVKTEAEQAAGVYNGNVTVDFRSFTVNVPVSVQVADIAVSEERHTKNVFLTSWQHSNGELEHTERLYDAYNEMLFRYRLSPNTLVTNSYLFDDEGIDYYVDKAYGLMQDVRCTNITVPYQGTAYNSIPCFEVVSFEKYIRAFAEKSFDTGYNMFAKLVCYFGFLDELNAPTDYNEATVKLTHGKLKEILEKVATEYENDATVVTENKAEIIDDIRNLRSVFTTWYKEQWADYVDTWCPLFKYYSADYRSKYDAQEEKWWYGCSVPNAPYPTYHIEDSLLSARAVGWMQAEYNIVGNLYWAVDYYGVQKQTDFVPLEDYYSTPNRGTFNSNGEGFLFYPGGQYGLDLPVATIRLEAIRDGYEEYELLYTLKQRYAEISAETGNSFTADKVIASLNANLHSDVKVKRNTDKFYSTREQLFELLMCADSPAGMAIIDSETDDYGHIEMKVLVKGENVLKANGEAVSSFVTVTNGRIYTINKTLDQYKNQLKLSVETGGKTYTYSSYLGGRVSTYSASALADSFKKEDVTPTAIVVNAPSGSGLNGQLVKIDIPASGENVQQSVKFTNSIINSIGATSDKIILHLYVDSSYDAADLTISAKYKKSNVYLDIVNKSLKRGLNVIEIPLADTNWNKLSGIDYLVFYFNSEYNQPARTIYLQDMVLFNA